MLAFANSLIHYDQLLNNKYTYTFFTEKISNNFENFKSKWNNVSSYSSLKSIETLEGVVNVDVSQKSQDFIRNIAKYSK